MDVLINICAVAFVAGVVLVWIFVFWSWRIQVGAKRLNKALSVRSNTLDAYKASVDAFKAALDQRHELLNTWQAELDGRDRAAHERRINSN